MADKIKVEIASEYDDKDAKKALADAEKIDKLDPEITITADDKASADISAVKEEAEALSKVDTEIVLRAKVDAAKADLASLQAELKATEEKAENTNRQLDRIGGDSGGIQTKGNAIADLTGPLGEASGAASDFAGVFDGLGDIAADTASKLGASASATAAISGVVGGLGIAVAAGAAAWTIFQGNQKKAREEAEKTVKVQKELNEAILEGNKLAAVKAFSDLYGDAIDDAVKAGASFDEATDFILGQADAVTSLEDRIASLTRERDREAASMSRQRAAGEAGSSQTAQQLDEAEKQLQALKDLREERNDNIRTAAEQSAREREIATALGFVTDELGKQVPGYEEINRQIEEAKQNVPELTALEAERTAGLEASAQAHRDEVDALIEQTNARRAAVDATFALHDAEANYAEALGSVDQELKDSEGDLLKQRQILEGVASNAADVADANVRIAEEEAKMRGEVVSATRKLDLQNDSLIDTAAQAKGPARQAILDYIGSINGIPADVQTYIAALVDQGKITEAQNLLDETSRARSATITADAETTKAEEDLAKAAQKKYTVDFYARAVDSRGRPLSGGLVVGAAGSGYTAEGDMLVGEEGPEIVRMPRGAQVIPASTSFAMMHNGNGSTAPMVVNVNMPKGSRGVDVAKQVSQQARRSGRRYGTPVVHYARR